MSQIATIIALVAIFGVLLIAIAVSMDSSGPDIFGHEDEKYEYTCFYKKSLFCFREKKW